MKKSGLLLMLALSSAACKEDPHDIVVPASMDAESPELKEAVQKLEEKDKELLLGYLVRREMAKAFNQDGPSGEITIGDAIEQQRSWVQQQERLEREQAALAEKARKEREAKERLLHEAVTVALTRKDFQESDWRRGIHMDRTLVQLTFQNKTDKPIAGVKGVIEFQDLFGDRIKQVNVSYDGGVAASSTSSWNGSLDYNQFMDEDVKLANTPLEKLKVLWRPEVILFEDGSKLSVE